MNIVDFFLCAVILLVTWIGYKKGAAEIILDMLKWAASIVCSLTVYYYTADLAETYEPHFTQFHFPVITGIVFMFSYLFLSMLQRWIVNRGEQSNKKSLADKVSGLIPGLLMGIIISIVIGRLLTYSVIDEVSREADKSEITTTFTPYTKLVEDKISPLVTHYITPKIASANTSVTNEADFKTETFFDRPDLEYEMLLLVNEERRQHHLKPLATDLKMKEVARAHSKDMFTRGFFAHTTPDGINPFQRMKTAGINYKKAGENLALAQTLAEAHKGLMQSPGHRAAILNPAFGRVGIAVIDGGKKGLMISQEFRD
ncbi:MAG: CvpA family protein [Chitinophagaceae bacterium]|nr:CvpA family protein [Chitinophagaceae bacterium]